MNAALLAKIPELLRPEVSAEFHALEIEVRLLSEALRLERLRRYCPSSEKLSDAQILLLELEPRVSADEVAGEAALPEEVKAATAGPQAGPVKLARVPIRKPLPAHLPRIEKIIACCEADCRCAQCQGEKKVIGYEPSETLCVKPAEYYVEVTLREKLACPKCEEMGVCVAPAPAKVVEKGILSNALVAEVILRKYCDHQPLYRQALGIKRDADVEISQATLGNAVMHGGALFIPVCEAMSANLLEGGYIQADETPVPVQSRALKGKNHRAYMWEYSRPHGPVVFNFRMGRGRDGPREFLKNFAGDLQSDGYAAYDDVGGATMKHYGCMAHARRKFCDASKAAPKDPLPVVIIKQIGELYAVESDARQAALDPAARAALRKEKSRPVLAALKAKIIETRSAVLPQSALGKACAYALARWEKLERYAGEGCGHVEIDNNWCENAIRGITLGRKNWLHIGSEEAGPKVAALMSVIETCKRLAINVRDYLVDVLPRLADRSTTTGMVSEFTPMAWKAAREAQAAKALPTQAAGPAESAR